jgi:predicted signal transduction protein with EAL and GGDEF domain
MLKIESVDDARVGKVGALTAQIVAQALASGLSWDEAIVAFGVAARAMAARAADGGVGSIEQCAALAERRLKSGMDHSAEVLRAFLG